MVRVLAIWCRGLRVARLQLFAVTAFGVICAAAYMSVLIVHRQQVLSGVSRYNLTWAATQSLAELLRLEQVVAAYSVPRSGVDKDEVSVRLDIMANRIEVLQHGELEALLRQTPELQTIVHDLSNAVEATGRLVEEIDRPGTISGILNLLGPLNPRMAYLAAKAHAFSGESVAKDHQELDRLHWVFSGLLMVVIACGIGLVVLLIRKSGVIRTAHDELRGLTEELGYAAHHDALTGLANRVLFYKEARLATKQQRECGGILAVLILDLDRFKEVNDTMGHPAGDALLKQVGQRLRGSLRPSDVVARLGGDEFAVMLRPIDRIEQASQLAARLIEAVSAPYVVEGQILMIGASIGAAICPDDGADADELIKHADIALYRAKGDGRATYRFFHPGMDSELHRQRAIAVDMRLALTRGEFEINYQPLVNLRTGSWVGAEALLRWKSPGRGMISPSEFIPIAEESGFIRPLGAWVLQQACAEAARWPKQMKVAVNLSAKQFFGEDLIDDVSHALESSGLLPNRLEVEITESVLLNDEDSVLRALHKLKSIGVRIALDDFGTGYSSLSYLRRFPFDKLKIDQCFTRDLEADVNSLHIIQAVTTLAQKLGMTTTAEGIESGEQLSRLKIAGCSEGQGYLFDRPLCAAEFRTNLENSTSQLLVQG